MEKTHKPSILTGIVAGVLLTPALMVLFFLGDRLAGLPFVPLDVFDRLTKTLPGGLVIFGIDRMIDVLTALKIGRLDSAAKTAEQIMGLTIFFLIGVVTVVLFFYVMSHRSAAPSKEYMPGVIFGVIVGVPLGYISLTTNITATAGPLLSILWMALLFIGWGAAVGWVYNDLLDLSVQPAAAEGTENSITQLSRRQFLLRVGGATASITVVGAALGAILEAGQGPSTDVALGGDTKPTMTDGTGEALPNANATVMPAPGTRPEYTPIDVFYRIDIASRPPVIDEASWTLPIHGLVENEMQFTLDDLRNNYPSQDQYATISCISNRVAGSLISTTRWTGVSLQRILQDVKPTADAGCLKITSDDGFFEFVRLDLVNQDPRIMLCYAWDGQPLTQGHGFPLRIWIPDLYGMKQPKWIVDIEVIKDWDEGYWVVRGWSPEARVLATSVVDTIAIDSIYSKDGKSLLPIGGIAYAGARGISKVELRIDDGDWQPAELRTPLSDTTWVIWRYDWEFTAGDHVFTVRCQEGDGTPQSDVVMGTFPSGATGLHSVETRVTT